MRLIWAVVAIVNIALAAAGMKKRVGILDADIFGPSIPSLMNLRGEPDITEKGNQEERDRMDRSVYWRRIFMWKNRRSPCAIDQLWCQVHVDGISSG